jgi:hypothetical protein
MSQSLVSLPLATCDLRTRVFAKKLCAERKHMETRHHLLTFAALRRAAVPHPGAREGIKPSETRSDAHHNDTGHRDSGCGRASHRYPCR